MSLTPAQRNSFLALMDLQTGAINELQSAREMTQTLLNELDVPEEEPPLPIDPGVWPSAGTWDDKIRWIHSQAGIKTPEADLKVVGPNFVPAGCRWNGTSLLIDTASVLENLIVPGSLVTTDRGVNPVTVRNVRAWDIFTWYAASFRRISVAENCEFLMPASRVQGGWGQGCINSMAPGFQVRRTICANGADTMQCSGGGSIEDSLFKDMTITSTTHNDFIQNYGGEVVVRRTHFLQNLTADQGSHVNGIFCDGGTYDIEDCAVEVFKPSGLPAWTIHAAKSGFVSIRKSLIRGDIIGDVRIGADVVRL